MIIVSLIVFFVLSGTPRAYAYISNEELGNQIQDFGSLISKPKMYFITAKHYLFDPDFRKAMNFLNAQDSRQLLIKMESSPEYNNIIQHFKNYNIDITVDSNLIGQIRRLELDLHYFSGESFRMPKTLVSFVEEVTDALPHKQLVDKINEHLGNLEFYSFYKAVTDPAFRTLVYKALVSRLALYCILNNSYLHL